MKTIRAVDELQASIVRQNKENVENSNINIISDSTVSNIKKKIILVTSYSCSNIEDSNTTKIIEDKEILELKKSEKLVAHPMCIPISLSGESIGYGLVDQGATRTIIRNTLLKKIQNKNNIKISKIKNMFVVGSTGQEIPILGCFATDISCGERFFSRSLIYIVDDKNKNDIICDFVLGRTSIANGNFPCVDTRGTGVLCNRSNINEKVEITCSPCYFTADNNGVMNLKLKIDNTTENNMGNENNIDVVNLKNEINNNSLSTKDEKFENESDGFSDDIMLMTHFMNSIVDKLNINDSEIEIQIIELFSSYIPDVVQKKSRIIEKNIENYINDEIQDEVESIDFPLTSPSLLKEDSPEYQVRKRNAIKEMIHENKNTTLKEKQKLIDLLYKYEDRFSLNGENMEHTDSVQHEIDTGDNRAFRERLRVYSPAIQKIIGKEVTKMEEAGVIQKSKSDHASNLLLVRKPDVSSEGGMKNRVCAAFV